jgi:tetratricopeptide (TPR) repeat protein
VTGASYLSQSTRLLHFGLGDATGIDSLEVRWVGGEPQNFGPIPSNSVWELIEGDPVARRLERELPKKAMTTVSAAGDGLTMTERERIVAFWEKQRAGMDAFKIEQDIPKAAGFFAEALELNPEHEDSRYYLANCLAVQGEIDEAMEHLERLMEINPLSHRAYKQWGIMRAMTAESPEELEAANLALERSLEINKEETGTILILGQIALMRGDAALAKQSFEANTGTNPRSTGGFYLQAYLAWKQGDSASAAALLEKAADTRGEDWKPEGAAAEGDVAQRMHKEVSPLSIFWEQWDGTLDPETAFSALERYLAQDHPWTG